MNTHFKLQVIKHLPYKIAEKIFNSNVQMNRQNHVGICTVCVYIYICVCVCVCVCVLRITVIYSYAYTHIYIKEQNIKK
jgi:hypothetical protein